MPWTPEIIVSGAVIVAALVVLLYVVFRRRRARRRVVPAREPSVVLRDSLALTRQGLLSRLQSAWSVGKDAEARLAEVEEILLTADVGLKTTHALLAPLRARARELTDAEALRRALREQMRGVLGETAPTSPQGKPYVVLVAGVNGVGKTTTIGKLAYRYRQAGCKVLLVAADTFRAAASEQLGHWAERVGVGCVHHQAGADPSAVVYDGLKAALAREVDVVIIDTAGRLHVKANLIEELKKVARVIGRQVEGAPHESLLVIDATTGQNAMNQARVFGDALRLTGIVLTKLDGTAKGGAVLAVRSELGVPIRYVGFGEGLDDLAPFDPEVFLDALLAPSQQSASQDLPAQTVA